MIRKKWLMRAGIVALALLAGDFGVNVVLQTGRMRRSLTARFGTAFGRPVEVDRYDLSLLPHPRIEARGVTIGEDPAFGYEYFLRAERVTAGLRWSGLLRGRFEFGAFSFTRPSLTLARNRAGRWNLERWLPPVRQTPAAGALQAGGASAPLMGPVALPQPPIRLDLVEFDQGRINFKNEDLKLPFAFTGVSGKVEQVASGRWRLRLEAQPWRSGTLLQAAGTLQVQGDLAGTSTRLQPAELRFHWGEVSLADLVRLARGQDFGLRGDVTVDGVARSGMAPARSSPGAAPLQTIAPIGEWAFRVEARARQVHRWDLTERRDNPAVNLLLDGRWNSVSNELRIAPLSVEGPQSNARGELFFSLNAPAAFQLRMDSMGIQAADVLAWYRGFHEDVAEGVAAEGFLAGAMTVTGWPLTLQNAAFSSSGGTLRVPGLAQPVRIGRIEGGQTSKHLTLDPVWISLGAAKTPLAAAVAMKSLSARRRSRASEGLANAVLAAAMHDFGSGEGLLSLEGHIERVEDALAAAAALGRPLERGWKGKGSAAGALRWAWQGSPWQTNLGGHLDFANGELQVAGLNLPLRVNEAQLLWTGGKRGAHLGSVEGFGAEWSGDIHENSPLLSRGAPDGAPGWKFQLHADHLDAAELDRWTGPRARPGWLERLLPSLLGKAPPGAGAGASELIRRIRAEGEFRVDELTVEKLRLSRVKGEAWLQELRLDVRNATAEYAGGTVRGTLQAEFAPRPRYVVDAQMQGIRLADLLAPGKATRAVPVCFDGTASGKIHLGTEGVGREELLKNLAGGGHVDLRDVLLDGWNVSGSLSAGLPRNGASRWLVGKGEFAIRQGEIVFEPLRLGSNREQLNVLGSVSLSRRAALSLQAPAGKQSPGRARTSRLLRITGPLEAPRVSVETRIN